MSLSRRGFFRGLFGAGAAAVLAPAVKALAAPVMKVRQPGITTAPYQFGFTGWKHLDESFVVRPLPELSFTPKAYYVNVLLEKPGSSEAN